MIKYVVLLFIFFSASANASSFNSEYFKLDNGMEVVVITNTKVPAVSHMVWYRSGAQDEPKGKSGIAHFLEHLMFKGTKNYGKGEFSKIIAKAGGNDNAFTSTDYTAYFQNISRSKLELVMELESDRMRNLIFDKDEVLKERDVILEERSSRIDNDPSAILREQMKAALFLNHPYQNPLIGWRHEMEQLSLDDAKEWYNNYYAPNNAILIVSGDITKDELKPLAEKYYGSIKPRAVPLWHNIAEPKNEAARRVIVRDSKVRRPEWMRYYIAPSQKFGNSEDVYALSVLSHILGQSSTSRLYQRLVVEQQLAVSIGTSYDDLSRGPSIFSIYAVPKGNDLSTIENAIEKEISKITEDGVTKDELKRAKNSIIAESIYAKEDLKSLAYVYGQALSIGLSTDYVENWEKKIKDVSRKDIIRAAKNLFKDKNSVTGELYREEK